MMLFYPPPPEICFIIHILRSAVKFPGIKLLPSITQTLNLRCPNKHGTWGIDFYFRALLFSQWSYWNHQIPRDDLMMYFCYQWSNVFTNDSFCWWPPRFNCWQKIARCRLPWSDDAIVGDQGMMRVMRCYLRGHLYYMPRIRSDHTRPEYIITCTYCQATDQANEIRNSIFLEHQKHTLWTYMYIKLAFSNCLLSFFVPDAWFSFSPLCPSPVSRHPGVTSGDHHQSRGDFLI